MKKGRVLLGTWNLIRLGVSLSGFDRLHSCSLKMEARGLQRGMELERMDSEEGIRPASRKSSIMSLHWTAPVAVVDMKVKYALLDLVHGNGGEVSSTAMEVYEVLIQYMKLSCLVYDVPFHGVLEAANESGEDIRKSLQALICNPLYNTSRIRELSNSEHDWQGSHDMRRFVEFLGSDRWASACSPAPLCATVQNVI